MSRHDLYLKHQDIFERALSHVARRHRCASDEAQDFAGWVRLKLVESDYAMLAEYRGQASMGTYLAIVVQRLLLDYRIAKWGRWRPSAEAKRLGPLAVRLETLLARDRFTFDEAFHSIRAADPTCTRALLEDLRDRLPERAPGAQFEGEDALAFVPSTEASPDEAMIDEETAQRKRAAGRALAAVVRDLPAQDQILLRLRFAEGLQIAEIARLLHLTARPLYRRLERLASLIRERLASQGLRGEDFSWGGPRRSAPHEKEPAVSRPKVAIEPFGAVSKQE